MLRIIDAVIEGARGIIDDVVHRGEQALRDQAQRFDGGAPERLRVAAGAIAAAREGLDLVHVVFDDGTYDMVAFQQMHKYGRTSGVELGGYDVVGYAESLGARGHRVTRLEDLVPTVRAALAEPGPSVIDVPVDYRLNGRILMGDLSDAGLAGIEEVG